MDVTEIKLVIEAALLAGGRPLPFEKLVELFTRKGDAPDRAAIREALEALAADYAERGIELKEVSSGFRIQVRSSMADWLQPLWEERAPRYTRALLETLALIAYRQPITRGEIEEVRGVAVSSNIVRTLMERGWVRVVGHRDVPGKPAMLGTTREFLDYFGLRKLDDLPALVEFNEEPGMSPQGDFLESLGGSAEANGVDDGALVAEAHVVGEAEHVADAAAHAADEAEHVAEAAAHAANETEHAADEAEHAGETPGADDLDASATPEPQQAIGAPLDDDPSVPETDEPASVKKSESGRL